MPPGTLVSTCSRTWRGPCLSRSNARCVTATVHSYISPGFRLSGHAACSQSSRGHGTTCKAASQTDVHPARAAAKDSEEKQRDRLQSGTIADYAKSSQLLRDLMETYTTIQHSYNESILYHIERHKQLADTTSGLAYALLCEALGRQLPNNKPTC